MMNQNRTAIFKLALTTTLFVLLSSCGNTKSTQDSATSNNFSSTSTKLLASCNKISNTGMTVSSAVVQDQMGQTDPNWLKVKFSFLSSQATATGNIVKFFKWRIANGVPSLDQNPLVVYAYNLSTGAVTSAGSNQLTASTVSATQGYYIGLNDPQESYQVIKIVVYSSTGTVVAQSDSLIPQFYAKTSDYQYNADGSTRATGLQSLHPLASTSTSGWADSQFTSYFQAFCF